MKKKIWANLQRIIEQKLSLGSQNMGLESEIRDPEKKPIPDFGFRILGSKRHRIPDPDPQLCLKESFSVSPVSGAAGATVSESGRPGPRNIREHTGAGERNFELWWGPALTPPSPAAAHAQLSWALRSSQVRTGYQGTGRCTDKPKQVLLNRNYFLRFRFHF